MGLWERFVWGKVVGLQLAPFFWREQAGVPVHKDGVAPPVRVQHAIMHHRRSARINDRAYMLATQVWIWLIRVLGYRANENQRVAEIRKDNLQGIRAIHRGKAFVVVFHILGQR